MTAGVPQGSVLGLLFFLIYINDIVDDLSSDAKPFGDDTSLFTVVSNGTVAADQLKSCYRLSLPAENAVQP